MLCTPALEKIIFSLVRIGLFKIGGKLNLSISGILIINEKNIFKLFN